MFFLFETNIDRDTFTDISRNKVKNTDSISSINKICVNKLLLTSLGYVIMRSYIKVQKDAWRTIDARMQGCLKDLGEPWTLLRIIKNRGVLRTQ